MKKEFYEVGTYIYLLDENEVNLLIDLSNRNLLKFTPEKIEIYESENKAN